MDNIVITNNRSESRKKTAAIPANTPFTLIKPNCCGNCGLAFSKSNPCARKFLLSLEDKKVSQNKETVDIWLGLQTVFEWKSWNAVGCIDKRVALCSTCGIALAKLYRAVRAFHELTASFSYVDLLSKKLLKELQSASGSSEDAGKTLEGKTKTKSGRSYRASSGSGSDDDDGNEPMDTGGDDDPDYNPTDSGEPPPPPPPPLVEKPEVTLPITIPEEFIHDGDTDDEANTGIFKENICYKCAAGFDKATNLRRHLLLTHGIGDREKKFVCNVCGRAYYFGYLLKNHMAYHSEARPYPCPAEGCDKTFKCSSSLRTHNIHAHTDQFRHTCKFCPKQFKVKRDKYVHETYTHKTPKGLRRFSCINGCGSSYKRKFSMLEHARKWCTRRPYNEGSEEEELEGAIASIGGDDNAAAGGGTPRFRKPDPRPHLRKVYVCKRGCGVEYKCNKSYKRHVERCEYSAEDNNEKETAGQPEEASAETPVESASEQAAAAASMNEASAPVLPEIPRPTEQRTETESGIVEPSCEINFMNIIDMDF